MTYNLNHCQRAAAAPLHPAHLNSEPCCCCCWEDDCGPSCELQAAAAVARAAWRWISAWCCSRTCSGRSRSRSTMVVCMATRGHGALQGPSTGMCVRGHAGQDLKHQQRQPPATQPPTVPYHRQHNPSCLRPLPPPRPAHLCPGVLGCLHAARRRVQACGPVLVGVPADSGSSRGRPRAGPGPLHVARRKLPASQVARHAGSCRQEGVRADWTGYITPPNTNGTASPIKKCRASWFSLQARQLPHRTAPRRPPPSSLAWPRMLLTTCAQTPSR